MRIRTALTWLLASGLAWHAPALGASKTAASAAASLSQTNLRGALQGQSGIALDLNGDGNADLIVGAPRAQQKTAEGAVLVYLANAGGFPARPTTVISGKGNFGWSLAALGDVKGVGKALFAVGALNGSGEVPLAGTVTIYVGGDNFRKLITLSGERAMDRFGYTLAAGDLNADGYHDLIVGAPYHSPTPALYQKGAVYVFFGPDYVTSVKIPATSANGGLGFTVAAGDLNGDGIDDLLLQASGRVLCLYGSSNFHPDPISPVPDVIYTSGDSGFGKAIAVLNDLNGDGFRDVAVAADQVALPDPDDPTMTVANCGRLYILKGGTGKGTFAASAVSLAKIDGEPNGGRFGSVLMPMGDVNGDGTPDLAVSAVHADGTSWPMTGKIFLFSGQTMTAGATVALARAFPGDARDMHLGSFMAPVGGGRYLAAGAPTEDADTGKVRLFNLR